MESLSPLLEAITKSIHQQGWEDGYNDRQFDCSFPVGSPEYEAYCEGFNEGSWNS